MRNGLALRCHKLGKQIELLGSEVNSLSSHSHTAEIKINR
jgi:hypothetical protein